MNENKNTILMTEGSIFKNILFFAAPLILYAWRGKWIR